MMMPLFTPFLLVQNMQMVCDIITFSKTDPHSYNFTRLVGTHQALFFVLCNMIVVGLLAVVDVFVLGPVHILTGICYILPMLQVINRFMEEKQESLRKSNLATLTLLATIAALTCYLTAHSLSQRKTIERSFPLYVPWEERQVTLDTVEKEETESSLQYRLLLDLRFDGFIAFYSWVLMPIFNWILYPLFWVLSWVPYYAYKLLAQAFYLIGGP